MKQEKNINNTSNTTMNTQRTGFFAIVGKPNAGKSSLLNAIVGQKVSIVSFKPQTTRNKIVGVYTKDSLQLVFIDTPGFIRADNLLSGFMSQEIKTATVGVDGVIFVVDGTATFDKINHNSIKQYAQSNTPLVVVINKVDTASYDKVYPLIEQITAIDDKITILPISVHDNKNIELLLSECEKLSPLGANHYDSTQITDRTQRWLCAEIIREKILLFFEKEIPHGVSVVITEYNEKSKIIVISADIICEKESHKPILIGTKGVAIKKVGISARQDIEKDTEKKVYLQLFVKVREGWKDDVNYIDDLGYTVNRF